MFYTKYQYYIYNEKSGVDGNRILSLMEPIASIITSWLSGWLPSTDKIYVPSKALKKFLAYVSLSNILERTMDAAAIFSRFSGCW